VSTPKESPEKDKNKRRDSSKQKSTEEKCQGK